MMEDIAHERDVGGAVKVPLVSSSIPAYKVAPFIKETLNSVLAQTLIDHEVIVINDGSPDTCELERALEPYRERILYIGQDNRGAGAARNAGLRAARGRFVAFLNGDDIWLPNFLGAQLMSYSNYRPNNKTQWQPQSRKESRPSAQVMPISAMNQY